MIAYHIFEEVIMMDKEATQKLFGKIKLFSM